MALKKPEKDRRVALRAFIVSYLEQRTVWGKYHARPSQLRAAAKQLERSRRIPYEVAKALRAVA
jgi:hypothetical protein